MSLTFAFLLHSQVRYFVLLPPIGADRSGSSQIREAIRRAVSQRLLSSMAAEAGDWVACIHPGTPEALYPAQMQGRMTDVRS